MPRLLAPIAIALLAVACAGERTAPGAPSAPELAGRIYDTSRERFIDEGELVARLAVADFVLLGEQHDNALHHRLQARLVRALQAAGTPTRAVAFEMMGTDQQLAVAEYVQRRPKDAAGLGAALDWQASGWPAWDLYQPIAQAALDADGQIVAANLPRDDVRAVFEQGLGVLRTSVVERTGLVERLPAPLAASLRRELEAAHCGEVSSEMVEGMFRVQRARDAIMADRLAAGSGTGGGILIAGAGHVRSDRGVPWYLRRLRPAARIASLAFLEAREGLELPGTGLPFDFVWLTEATREEDPCAGFGGVPSRADAGGPTSAAHRTLES